MYLTNASTAASQSTSFFAASIGAVSNVYTFSSTYFTNAATDYLLFEAAGIGKGELVLTVTQNGTNVASTSVVVGLKDVRDMFEHADVENVTSGSPPSALVSRIVLDNVLQPDPTESKQIIVYVHGMNELPWNAENFAQTMFKRLYWAGYQGRFAVVRWQCAYLQPPSGNPLRFNVSEYYAWKSGTGLKNYLTYVRNNSARLPGYKINIIAHSQGGLVSSEAFEQGAPFDSCIFTQVAVPAHCYDTNTNNVPLWVAKTLSRGRPTRSIQAEYTFRVGALDSDQRA